MSESETETAPTIRSDSTLLLDVLDDHKDQMRDMTYKTALEALGRLRVVQEHTCRAHTQNPIPIVFVNDVGGGSPGLPFKIEKTTIFTASPLDYPDGNIEFEQNILDDEDSGLQILYTSTVKIV